MYMTQKHPHPENRDGWCTTTGDTNPSSETERIQEAVASDTTLSTLWLQLFDDADP